MPLSLPDWNERVEDAGWVELTSIPARFLRGNVGQSLQQGFTWDHVGLTLRFSVWRYPISERNRIWKFFLYQIFLIPNPILFSIPSFFDTESGTFSDIKFLWYRIRKFQNRNVTQNTQNLNETESKTFSNTKFFRYWIRYFYQYQILTIPNPILFLIPIFLLPNPKPSKKIEKFRNRNVTLCLG